MSDRLALIIANSEFDDSRLTRLVTPSRDADPQTLGPDDFGQIEMLTVQ